MFFIFGDEIRVESLPDLSKVTWLGSSETGLAQKLDFHH